MMDLCGGGWRSLLSLRIFIVLWFFLDFGWLVGWFGYIVQASARRQRARMPCMRACVSNRNMTVEMGGGCDGCGVYFLAGFSDDTVE